MHKKSFFVFCLLILLTACCAASSYHIDSVSYETKGWTREYALSQKVPVDTETVFTDKEAFDAYVANLRQLLGNQRVFQTTDVQVEYGPETDGIIPVTMTIVTVDTLNIIGIPYPSYNSNTGITLKIKVKDYNFFGSMETMDFDLNYQAKGTDDLKNVSYIYGLNFGFAVPFSLLSIPASWNSNFNFSYTVGNPEIDMTICEGISFSIPIADVTKANISFNQYYIQNAAYSSTHDDKYFQEAMSLSLPFKVASIPNWSTIYWSPSISLSYNWDADVFNGAEFGGMTYKSLRGPSASFTHGLSGGRINWTGNFREGFSASLSQTYGYNLYSKSPSMSITFNSQYHARLCSFIGLSSRQRWYKNFYDSTTTVGPYLRGIRDKDWSSSDFFYMNLDLPVKVVHTNWGALFGWSKLNFFNFEMQLSPFLDVALGKNTYAGKDSLYNLKDGWYGTGLECILFPDRFRSIQGRISFGVDAVQFLEKTGRKVSALNGVAANMFNMDWRRNSSSWYELSIGIGLFY